MKETIKKPIEIIVGIILIGLCLKLFLGSGAGDSVAAPLVETDRIGDATADILSKLFEFVIGIAGGIGGLFILNSIRIIDYIVDAVVPFFNREPTPPPVQRTTVGIEDVPPTSPEMFSDLSKILAQAAIDGDKELLVAVAEKMAGKPFLRQPKLQNTFPSNEAK